MTMLQLLGCLAIDSPSCLFISPLIPIDKVSSLPSLFLHPSVQSDVHNVIYTQEIKSHQAETSTLVGLLFFFPLFALGRDK